MQVKKGRVIALLFCGLCSILYVSARDGIRFNVFQHWKDVLAAARVENKFIFVDCYATWCGPCKDMDRTTYQDDKVGDFVSDRFICIRVQMDTTNQDNELIKSWYPDASSIAQTYGINEYPSFLFFSPDGKIVHRDVGYKNENDFISLLSAALDPQRQFYTLMMNYQSGKKNYSTLRYLINLVQKFGDDSLTKSISDDYLNNYLFRMNDVDLYSKDNIEFIGSRIQGSNDRGFMLFYGNEKRIDQLMGQKMFAEKIIEYAIYREIVYPKMIRDGKAVEVEPEWRNISNEIADKYSSAYAARIILNAKITWYYNKKDWENVIKYRIEKIEGEGMDTTKMGMLLTNDFFYTVIFMHSNDSAALGKSLRWEKLIIEKYPTMATLYDTYANLLYKLGRTREALEWEEKAYSMDSKNRETIANYNKMKKGEPTWAVSENR